MQRRSPFRALVTGGAGFIGSHLVEALLAEGADVRVLDDLSTGKRENLPDVPLVEGDLRDDRAVREAVRDRTVIFHLAARTSVPRSVKEPLSCTDINVNGTVRLLEEAVRAGVGRVVFTGSSSVYGDHPELPRREDQPPRPTSPYAASKIAGETFCRAFHRSLKMETTIVRLFNVYGPRQDPDSPYAAVIPLFLTRLKRGEDLPVYGDGLQTRDFTFVEDVVRGFIAAARRGRPDGRIYNLCASAPVTLKELAERIAETTQRRPVIRFEPPRSGDLRDSFGDNRRAREELGFQPSVSLEEGLRRTWLALNRK